MRTFDSVTPNSAKTIAAASGMNHLHPDDVDVFREQLNATRRQLVREMTRLQREVLTDIGTVAQPGTADGQDTWEQMIAIRTLEGKRALLYEIDQALGRMAEQRYGLCVADGRPIPKERLEDIPWIKHCEHCSTHARPGMPADAFGFAY